MRDGKLLGETSNVSACKRRNTSRSNEIESEANKRLSAFAITAITPQSTGCATSLHEILSQSLARCSAAVSGVVPPVQQSRCQPRQSVGVRIGLPHPARSLVDSLVLIPMGGRGVQGVGGILG